MNKHIIFCFSGTGNSLYVAKQISANLSDTLIVPMTGKIFEIEAGTESVGFVYPTYFSGIPRQVAHYVEALSISSNTYSYAIATYGGMLGNGFKDLNTLIKIKNTRGLDYAEGILMFENYVAMYSMKNSPERVAQKTENSDNKLKPIIQNIKDRKKNQIKKSNPLIKKYYDSFSVKCFTKEKDFNVSDQCTSCRRCEKICPVQNITMKNNKPSFNGNCEQCMACIQTCPVEAINYKNKTQTRGRYFNPSVKVQELVTFNHQND